MAGSGLLAALGAGGGAAAGGAAAGGFFAAGGLGAKLVGGLVSGLGAGLMKRSEYREEERQRVAETQRMHDSYEGAGEAVRFWDQQPNDSARINPEYQRADPNSNRNLRVGQREVQQLPGEQYRIKPQPEAAPAPPVYRYDPQSGQIQRS